MPEAVTPDRSKPAIAVAPELADRCLACGTCIGACPATESVPGWDARKAIRALALGLEQEVVDSKWPWVCTMCGRCEYNCPQGVKLTKTFRACRGARARDKVPGTLHQGILMNLERGNNFGIPQDDYVQLLAELGVEMEEDPDYPCPGFYVPVDKEGANLMMMINARVPYTEPDNLKWWWRIFYAAKEDWTQPAVNWDGVNWALYTGDDASLKIGVTHIIENARRLKVKTILYPEWGHAYYATRFGFTQWFPEVFEEFRVMSMFDLLKDYFDQARIKVDPTIHPMPATVHDPCNYVRKSQAAFGDNYSGLIRWLAAQCCPSLVEMCNDPLNNYCCGNGGGMQVMPNETERQEHGQFKADQIRATGAELVVAPCHNCREQIKNFLGKKCDLGNYRETKYLWEIIADSLIYEPWSETEIAAAHQARDEQFMRFGVDLEEMA